MKRILTIISIFSLSIFYMLAQTTGISLNGVLTDKNLRPVEFANIYILNTDSSSIKTGATTIDGRFTISIEQAGDYIVKCESMGYKAVYINISDLHQSIDIGNIVLNEDTRDLNEIEIKGLRVINKVDRHISIPTELQINTSVQGIELLKKLGIPEIIVEPEKVIVKSTDDGNVQLRINGIRVSPREISGIKADDVLRVETYNGLNARFGGENASVIVDFILKRKKTGGSVIADLQNAPFTTYGNDVFSTKLNYKNSQFGIFYYLAYREYKNRYIDTRTEFNFPDNSFYRLQNGIKIPYDYQTHLINLTYNLVSTNKYTLNIESRNEILDVNNNLGSSSYYSNTGQTTFNRTTAKSSSYSPTLDLLFKYKLSPKQNVMANLVATYTDSNSKRYYKEYNTDSTLFNFNSKELSNKYSLIAEAVYENQLNNKLVFNAGINNAQDYAKTTVIQSKTAEKKLSNANTYMFAQLQGWTGQVNYTLGIGGSRIWFKDSNSQYTYYVFRPTVQLTYKPSNTFSIRYHFSIDAIPPSLAQLNNVLQPIDGYQANLGNPDLHPYKTYNNILNFNYNKGIINSSINLRYIYSDKPIMNEIILKDNLFINTYYNQAKLLKYGVFANMRIQLIKNIWAMEGTSGVDRFHSQGERYSHHYSSFWGNLNTNGSYYNFDITFGVSFRTSVLWGEVVNYNNSFEYVDLAYRHKTLRFGIGLLQPFSNARITGSKNLSELRPETTWSYTPDNGHMLYLRLSWNMSFGKKHETEKKPDFNTVKNTDVRKND